MSLLGPGAGWTALVPKRDQGRAAILPWDLKGTRAVQPALGPKRDIGHHALVTKKEARQPALVTKKGQGSLP